LITTNLFLFTQKKQKQRQASTCNQIQIKAGLDGKVQRSNLSKIIEK